jgi:hypothetical protein
VGGSAVVVVVVVLAGGRCADRRKCEIKRGQLGWRQDCCVGREADYKIKLLKQTRKLEAKKVVIKRFYFIVSIIGRFCVPDVIWVERCTVVQN